VWKSILAEKTAAKGGADLWKNDPDIYYQESLELLEAMLTAAEFREPVDSWFE